MHGNVAECWRNWYMKDYGGEKTVSNRLFDVHGGVEDMGDLYIAFHFKKIGIVMSNWKRS